MRLFGNAFFSGKKNGSKAEEDPGNIPEGLAC